VNEMLTVLDGKQKKIMKSSNGSYNSIFNKENGLFLRWGKTADEDPEWCEYGPEIADIEVSTICHNGCTFCYKSNTTNGKYMTLETFKKVFEKLPKTVTQIAFGIGDIDSNPDLYSIMEYCRNNGVIPNITINGKRMTAYDYDRLVGVCGAVAVSYYDDMSCIDAIKNLGQRGLKQINIHCLMSEETYEQCMKAASIKLWDLYAKTYLNAVVFLWLKPKGDTNTYHQISEEHYKNVIKNAMFSGTNIGFDSCSAPHVLRIMPDQRDYIEPCESTLFSIYINVDGKAFPCSFCEGVNGYNGMDVVNNKDFNKVWLSEEFVRFRSALLDNKDENECRNCPIYKLEYGVGI
jgi:radical SAM protein with 4Fe4S-binding SPASM domain